MKNIFFGFILTFTTLLLSAKISVIEMISPTEQMRELYLKKINVHYLGTDFAVIRSTDKQIFSDIVASKKHDINDFAICNLAVVYHSGGKDLKLSELIVKTPLLWRSTRSALVGFTNLEELNIYHRIGLRTEILSDKTIPLNFMANVKESIPETGFDPAIQNLVSEVNQDSVTSYIKELQNFQTRYAFAANRRQVAFWIKNKFASFGITEVKIDSFFVAAGNDGTFQHSDSWLYNVEAKILGLSSPQVSAIVGAHHDSHCHYDQTPQPFLSAPGADDNASGTAAVLEIARVMKQKNFQPESTIRFVTFTAEEPNPVMQGSRNYVSKLIQNKQVVKFYLNNDMIAYNTRNENKLMSIPYTGYERYHLLAKQSISQYTTLTAIDGHTNEITSDLQSFYDKGIPSGYYFEQKINPSNWAPNPFYHTSNDIIANMDMNYCTQAVKASCAMMAQIVDRYPAAVRGLSFFTPGDGQSLRIRWLKNYEINLSKYKILVLDSVGTVKNEYFTTDTFFTINNLMDGRLYRFGFTAVNTSNFESVPFFQTIKLKAEPEAPKNLKIEPQWHKIKLSWSKNNENDLKGYNIYRKASDQFQYNKIELLGDTSYVDNNCLSSKWYDYYITALDSINLESPASQIIRCGAISLDKGLLVVDASADGVGTLNNPDDNMQDTFFSNITSSFPQVTTFDANSVGKLTLSEMGPFSTIFIHNLTTSFSSVIKQNISEIKKYLDIGGNILIFADKPGRLIESDSFYPCKFDTSSIAYKYFGLDSAYFNAANLCNGAIPLQSNYSYLTVDSAKASFDNSGHIKKLETLRSRTGVNKVYAYDSQYAISETFGSSKGKTIGIENLTSNYKTFVMAMPLYYIKENEAKQLVEYVINERFITSINDDNKNIPHDLAIISCYPNPFNPSTSIKYFVKNNSNIKISIYNALGEIVTTLFNGKANSGNHSINFNATGLNSGVYFVKLSTDKNLQFVQKILMVK